MAFAVIIALFLLWITMHGELATYAGFATGATAATVKPQ